MCAIADICMAMQDYDEAKESAQMSRDIFTDLEDLAGQENALTLEVEAHIESGDGVEALSTAEEVVKMYRKSGDKLKEAEAMFGCVRVLYMKGDLDEMNKLAKETRSLCERVEGSCKVEGLVLHCVIKAQMHNEEVPDAVKTAKEAIQVYKKGGDTMGEASALHSCACIALDKFFKDTKDNQKALIVAGYSKAAHKESDIPAYKEAVDMVERAYELYEEIGDKESMQLVADTMANINIRATMLNEPDETREIHKGTSGIQLVEVVEIWNKTEVKLTITRDGKDREKILDTKYEIVPMAKETKDTDAALENSAKPAAIAG